MVSADCRLRRSEEPKLAVCSLVVGARDDDEAVELSVRPLRSGERPLRSGEREAGRPEPAARPLSSAERAEGRSLSDLSLPLSVRAERVRGTLPRPDEVVRVRAPDTERVRGKVPPPPPPPPPPSPPSPCPPGTALTRR
jgi:hypothetical protein